MFESLPRNHFHAIAADPGTRFDARSPKGIGARSPEMKYTTQTDAEIAAWPVGELARDHAFLFYWDTTRSWLLLVLILGVAAAAAQARLAATDPGTGEWPMWGGSPDRNMVSSMKGVPTEWDVKTKKNVKWVADLGSQSYGNPVVGGGM